MTTQPTTQLRQVHFSEDSNASIIKKQLDDQLEAVAKKLKAATETQGENIANTIMVRAFLDRAMSCDHCGNDSEGLSDAMAKAFTASLRRVNAARKSAGDSLASQKVAYDAAAESGNADAKLEAGNEIKRLHGVLLNTTLAADSNVVLTDIRGTVLSILAVAGVNKKNERIDVFPSHEAIVSKASKAFQKDIALLGNTISVAAKDAAQEAAITRKGLTNYVNMMRDTEGVEIVLTDKEEEAPTS